MLRYDFNSGWKCNGRKVTLPHDAMITAERRADAPSESGGAYFSGGKYIYTKEFDLPAEWVGKQVKLQFEGVYKNAGVSVNGTKLGGAAYGYIPFWIDCGVLAEGRNIITVVCENEQQPDSRWYSGAGIYRPLWAWVGEGITGEDIRITTLSAEQRTVLVETHTDGDADVAILDGETVLACGKGNKIELELPDAKLWSEEQPYLYTCRVNDVEVKFGIRQISWSSKGLFVNGKEVLLRGGCVHHDSGILGTATLDESEWRRVRILKEGGYNAIRSAHNPCSRAMLEACDYYGMYLIDEAWDMWYNHKSPYDYASLWEENYRQDLASMVCRDYNHPCVIAYSIGNEVSEPAGEKGISKAKEMAALLHSMDSTRPVTGGFNLMIIANAAKGKGIYDEEKGGRKNDDDKKVSGMNSTMFNFIASMVGTGMNKAANSKQADAAVSPCLDALDLAGYNYASGRYAKDGELHPDRIIYGSETFPQDIAKNWAMVEKLPYLIGDFMWTAWDYLGEAGLGAWAYTSDGKGFNKPYPWLLADAGAYDILGNPNGEAFLAAAVWDRLEKPMIAVQPVNHPGINPAKGVWRGTNAIPSWSWKNCEGNKAVIEVYFKCDKIELFLNDRSLGRKKVRDCKVTFKTKYVPGELKAVAYQADGMIIAQSVLNSAKETGIHISPEKITARPGEVVYAPVSIGDGINTESNDDRIFICTVENGELLAFGSANPRTEESFHSGSCTTYYGKALAIVRAMRPGKMKICIANKTAEIAVE